MKRRELVDLLAEHADALNYDAAAADRLANHPLLASFSSLLTLLHLAQAVKQVLTPVELSPAFRSGLKAQLDELPLFVEAKRPFPKTIVVGAAVSVIGLAIFLLRRFRPADTGVVTAV